MEEFEFHLANLTYQNEYDSHSKFIRKPFSYAKIENNFLNQLKYQVFHIASQTARDGVSVLFLLDDICEMFVIPYKKCDEIICLFHVFNV